LKLIKKHTHRLAQQQMNVKLI